MIATPLQQAPTEKKYVPVWRGISDKSTGLVHRLGRLWGRYVCCIGLAYLDRRISAFELTVYGLEHLEDATRQPCLIVANHLYLRHGTGPLGPWLSHRRIFRIYNAPVDSFLYRRIVRENTVGTIRVVARTDRGWWSPRPVLCFIQKTIGQPFGKGMREGMGYIPIEHNPNTFHRPFYKLVQGAIDRGESILIFPGKSVFENGVRREAMFEEGLFPGVGHLASKFRLPILPAHTRGIDGWRPGQSPSVMFGSRFEIGKMTKDQINEEIIARIFAVKTEHDALFASELAPTSKDSRQF